MSNFQGQILDPELGEKNQKSRNKGMIFSVISLLLVIASFFAGLLISNSKIDASWKQPSFKAVEVNKEFQFSTSGTSACDTTATDGCVAFRFVSKYDCQQVSGLVALIDSAGNTIASLSAAKSDISQGVPIEIKFNLTANSDEVVDTNLLDLKCFR